MSEPTVPPPLGPLAAARVPVFSFDAETDGLYGDVWAVGACVLNTDGQRADVFGGQLDPDVVTDPWVRKHVVPVVALPRFDSRDELLHAFWGFWMSRPADALCVADFGAPVEAGLFRAAVALHPLLRTFAGPYPMHELGTALLLAGVDPDVDRREYVRRPDLRVHDPVDDALAAALSWQQAATTLGLAVAR